MYLFAIVNFFKGMDFAHPYAFFLLLLIIPLIGWQIWQRKKMQASLTLPTVTPLLINAKTWRTRLIWLPNILRILVLCLLITALARPQQAFKTNNVEVEGVDIVLALDVSGSMKAMDFKPNRLEACKSVAKDFIEGRPTDRIGLVLYAGEAYTQCPVTTDHNTLLGLLKSTKFDLVEDGTAIGDGLGTAINRLKDSEAKSKIIILLSDGVNNRGYMDPYSAAQIAKNFKIKVYTIGCGTNGNAPYPTPQGPVFIPTEIDEVLLQNIAHTTGGQYFRANNNEKLKTVYNEIDKMEKTIFNELVFEHKSDAFAPFLIIAILLLIIEIALRYWVLKLNP